MLRTYRQLKRGGRIARKAPLKGGTFSQRSKPRSESKRLLDIADELTRQACYAQGGRVAAGRVPGVPCRGRIQCGHIVNRWHKTVRHNPRNVVPICEGHHEYYTPRKAKWHIFIDAILPGRRDEINEIVKLKGKPDYEAAIASYRGGGA